MGFSLLVQHPFMFRDAILIFTFILRGLCFLFPVELSLMCSPSVKSVGVKYEGSDGPLGTRPDDMHPELFNSFTSVKRLQLDRELVPFIAAALQGLSEESAAGALPALCAAFPFRTVRQTMLCRKA
jgi:hypothetical protein